MTAFQAEDAGSIPATRSSIRPPLKGGFMIKYSYMTLKVFIEQVGGSNEKNVFDKKTGAILGTTTTPLTHPYSYGYILDTISPDGDNVDCFIISDKNLAAGVVVECEPIGMVEWFEDEQSDHKILVKFAEESKQVDVIVQQKIIAYTTEFIKNRSDKQYRLGKFYDKKKAEELIASSRLIK